MATSEDIEGLVAPVVSSAGFELVDVELTPAPRVLRVRVDAPEGVELDDLGPLAKSISRLLDEADAMPGGHYDLEVSSPGLERPLRRPEHFARAVGAKVRMRTRPGTDGQRRLEGVIVAADERSVQVMPDAGGESRDVLYQDIERAHTVFDWQAALAAAPKRPSGRAARRQPAEPSQPTDSTPPTDSKHQRERAATP
jgi:ribosome maturation factor RimP